ncbi:MAG: leucyl/phenylalanyl-tRNA--protein transferase [Flavobacteriales bacterium]
MRPQRPDPPRLTPELLLRAYRQGLFPMVHEDGALYWHDPDSRAIIPLERVRMNSRLRRAIRSAGLVCTTDRAFEAVMRGCADRDSTWIDAEMIATYTALHAEGYALSAETWLGDELVGGLYGVRIGRAFFGESMFSRVSNASKAAFHHAVACLREQGFLLFDTQYINDHTRSLGAIEVPRAAFRRLLVAATA